MGESGRAYRPQQTLQSLPQPISHNAYYVNCSIGRGCVGFHALGAKLAPPPDRGLDMNVDFEGDWYGWRLRGRHLVSDDGQRMTLERLRGLMWRDQMELRLAGYASRRRAEEARKAYNRNQLVKVLVVSLADYRHRGVAAS